jgi:hypothetical protein
MPVGLEKSRVDCVGVDCVTVDCATSEATTGVAIASQRFPNDWMGKYKGYTGSWSSLQVVRGSVVEFLWRYAFIRY